MPKKMDKQAVSDTFNELLGTNINWTKLSIAELEQLLILAENTDKLAKEFAKQKIKDRVDLGARNLKGLIDDVLNGD